MILQNIPRIAHRVVKKYHSDPNFICVQPKMSNTFLQATDICHGERLSTTV